MLCGAICIDAGAAAKASNTRVDDDRSTRRDVRNSIFACQEGTSDVNVEDDIEPIVGVVFQSANRAGIPGIAEQDVYASPARNGSINVGFGLGSIAHIRYTSDHSVSR